MWSWYVTRSKNGKNTRAHARVCKAVVCEIQCNGRRASSASAALASACSCTQQLITAKRLRLEKSIAGLGVDVAGLGVDVRANCAGGIRAPEASSAINSTCQSISKELLGPLFFFTLLSLMMLYGTSVV